MAQRYATLGVYVIALLSTFDAFHALPWYRPIAASIRESRAAGSQTQQPGHPHANPFGGWSDGSLPSRGSVLGVGPLGRIAALLPKYWSTGTQQAEAPSLSHTTPPSTVADAGDLGASHDVHSSSSAGAMGTLDELDAQYGSCYGGDGSAAPDPHQHTGSASSRTAASEPPAPRPVIFIPPLTATGIEARLHKKPSVPRWWCPRSSTGSCGGGDRDGWYTLWVSALPLLPGQFPCFADNMRLEPSGPHGAPRSPPGVTTRLAAALEPRHGAPPGARGPQDAWGAISSRLRARGWPAELFETHPYDWRLTPVQWSEPSGSFDQLRAQVEAQVEAAGGRRAVLVGLSLGGPYAATFLARHVDEEWKQRHVERLVALSGPWAGTPTALLDVLSARLEGLEAVLDSTAVRQLLQGLPSLTWSFPAVPPVEDAGAGHTHGGTGAEFAALGSRQGEAAGEVAMGAAATGWPAPRAVLVNRATGKEYGPGELGQALRDAGANETAVFWDAAQQHILIPAPNVTTYCFYSYGLPSAASLSYSTADFSDTPQVQYGDGDITVPHASLALCRGWGAAQGQGLPVFAASYPRLVHAMLTESEEAAEDVVGAVAGDTWPR